MAPKSLIPLTVTVVILLSVASFVDHFFVIRRPDVCRLGETATSSTAADTSATECTRAYRAARRSLGARAATSAQVVAAMAAGALAQVKAVGTFAATIARGDGGRHHWIQMATDDCAEQIDSAAYYTELARSALQRGTNADDVPYWLATAASQVRNCADGFQTDGRTHVAAALAGSVVKVHATRASAALSTLISITVRSAAKSAQTATHGTRLLEDAHAAAGEAGASSAEPSWVRRGLYEGMKELQARMRGDHEAARMWGQRRAAATRHTRGRMLQKSALTPNAVVDKNGNGNYTKIKDAIKAAPKSGQWVVYIRRGTYKEQVLFSRANVILIGEGRKLVTITASKSVGGGSTTYKSATLGNAKGKFAVLSIRIANTAGISKHQAVAMRASGDQSVFFDCGFEGNQDTLYVDSGRQYYRNCYVGGTVDFIFGDAAAVIDCCTVQLHKSKSFVTITASGRESADSPTGIVIWNSTVQADSGVSKVYLGRPWKECARTVFVNTYMPQEVLPEGWRSWNEGDCLYYAQAGSTGPGASTDEWADWALPGTISSSDAQQFGPNPFTGVNGWWDMKKLVPKW
eukprot:TRINITY_DN25234_c0_g1_i3.p1 TRINITY_DN25234_c0_g1~~TRINITY_DN25234_c0_g1_i3.p1  ORF type:complete len:576 (-),score=-11.75 TRINITY_DN25234_c0_g1_i3:175-1902(-)